MLGVQKALDCLNSVSFQGTQLCDFPDLSQTDVCTTIWDDCSPNSSVKCQEKAFFRVMWNVEMYHSCF